MSQNKNKTFLIDKSIKFDSETTNKRDRKQNKQLLKRVLEMDTDELTDLDTYDKI